MSTTGSWVFPSDVLVGKKTGVLAETTNHQLSYLLSYIINDIRELFSETNIYSTVRPNTHTLNTNIQAEHEC
jgi:hypothetical protein